MVAVSTEMPLKVDGPKDYGIDEVCAGCNICTRFCPGDAIKPDKFCAQPRPRAHQESEDRLALAFPK